MMLRFLYNNFHRSTTNPNKLDSTQLLNLLKNPSFVKPRSSFSTKSRPHDLRSLSLFTSYGLTEPQISKLAEKIPALPSYGTLKPKLDFFNSIGVSVTDLIKIIMRDPTVFDHSLENRILPSYSFLKSVLHTNENFVAAMKRSGWILKTDVKRYVAPNIEFLRGLGVPESRISFIVRTHPGMLVRHPDPFEEIVVNITEMGFDPSKSNFLTALLVFTGFTKSSREQKFEVYRKWGWSEDEIILAFRKQPWCMTASVDKINRVMDFVVNKMGWNPSDVVGFPLVVKYSLENWTKPRCLVVGELLSKGLIKDFKLSYVITLSEKKFLDKFVTKYCTENPELLKLYKERVEIQEFATRFHVLDGWWHGAQKLLNFRLGK